MVYEGNLLPEEYFRRRARGRCRHQASQLLPARLELAAAFRTEYKIFLASDDPWFRPVDACTAPDGSVFVADWYDAGVGGHAFSDQTTGRIFRVAPKGNKCQKVKVDFASVRRIDHGTQVAECRHPGCGPEGLDRARQADAPRAVATPFCLCRSGLPATRRALCRPECNRRRSGRDRVAQGHRPRIREQAVRMLGRDCRENGKVESTKPEARRPSAALAHLDVLLPMADDPDPGVRRELILALRSLSTDKVAMPSRRLAAAWDGQDRWYLEALGLALEKRESRLPLELFSMARCTGDLDLERSGAGRQGRAPALLPGRSQRGFHSRRALPINPPRRLGQVCWAWPGGSQQRGHTPPGKRGAPAESPRVAAGGRRHAPPAQVDPAPRSWWRR